MNCLEPFNYRVMYTDKAIKQMQKLDKYSATMIRAWITKNLDGCSNPRLRGKALNGNKSGHWRYRIGDYRLICKIEDNQLVILALTVGHRREIYD